MDWTNEWRLPGNRFRATNGSFAKATLDNISDLKKKKKVKKRGGCSLVRGCLLMFIRF